MALKARLNSKWIEGCWEEALRTFQDSFISKFYAGAKLLKGKTMFEVENEIGGNSRTRTVFPSSWFHFKIVLSLSTTLCVNPLQLILLMNVTRMNEELKFMGKMHVMMRTTEIEKSSYLRMNNSFINPSRHVVVYGAESTEMMQFTLNRKGFNSW